MRGRACRHYLDVQHSRKDLKTRVWVYEKNETDAQLWRFDDAGRLERFSRCKTFVYPCTSLLQSLSPGYFLAASVMA